MPKWVEHAEEHVDRSMYEVMPCKEYYTRNFICPKCGVFIERGTVFIVGEEGAMCPECYASVTRVAEEGMPWRLCAECNDTLPKNEFQLLREKVLVPKCKSARKK